MGFSKRSLCFSSLILPTLRSGVVIIGAIMNAMNLSIAFLLTFYFLAVAERLTQPEIIGDDGESEGLDQYYEQQYRDYTIAADKGYVGDW